MSNETPIPFPIKLSPDELSNLIKDKPIMNPTSGPDFESLTHEDFSMDNLLQIPEPVLNKINEFIDTRVITNKQADEYNLSDSMKIVLDLYRKATQQYYAVDYLINYKSEPFIKYAMEDAPEPLKQIIKDNSVAILTFGDPRFLGLLMMYFLIQTVLEYTILPNTQNFGYSDIPESPWYIPMYITRFIGNMFFFIFYTVLLLWAGMRRLVNDKCSIPMILSYMSTILLSVQLIFLFYISAISGELPSSAITDSLTAILSYMVPLLLFSFTPSIFDMIPSSFVRQYLDIPLLAEKPVTSDSIQYSTDLSIMKCYTSGEFFKNSIMFAVLYAFFTYAFYPLDPTLTKFTRSDVESLKHRKDVPKPPSLNQSMTEKHIQASLYHIITIFTVCISAISITGMPKGYNDPNKAFYHALLFACVLPLGKLLIEFKYASQFMNFYSVFYDFIFTILRIMIPITIVTRFEDIKGMIAYFIYMDSTKPIPSWMIYTGIIITTLLLTLLLRVSHPAKDSDTKEESFVSPIQSFHKEEGAEKGLREIIGKAKTLLASLQQMN